jgi:hypothetical protein
VFTIAALAVFSVGAAAHDEQWASLDRDIEALAASGPAQQQQGMQIGALLRLLYGYASDTNGLLFPGIDDISGFAVERAQIDAEGQIEDYGFRLQLEAAGGTATLLDAYGTWQINEYVRTSMGNFRAPFLWESLLDDGNRLLILRTDAGEFFYQRDVGAMVDGQYDRLHWAAAIQNGFDGVGDEYMLSGRVGVDILGAGIGMQQGAYGLESGADLTWNFSILDEAAAPEDGTLYATDAQFRLSQFSADAQYVKLPDDPAFLGDRADAGLWAATVAYMVVPEKYEIAVRYQDTDNIDDDGEFTIGVNRYVVGHDVKWQLNFASADSDDSEKEFDVILLGLNIRI